MKANLFTIQVLGLIAFIPALIVLEFNHKKEKTIQKESSVKITNVNKTITPAIKDRVIANKDLPHGIVLLYY